MKQPFVTLEKVREIAQAIPTPFHLYDEKGILDNFCNLKRAFDWNKGYREYFAVKACPNPYILKLLLQNGGGFDCASAAELALVERISAKGDDIMFSSNDTPADEFAFCKSLGGTINLDDYTHIDALYETCGIPETVSIRFNPGGSFEIKNTQIMGNPSEAKYGMTKEQLFRAIVKLSNLGAKRFGLHSFLASNTIGNEYYPTLAGILFEMAVEIKQSLGISISFINLSGGIGIPYRPEQQPNDIAVIGDAVRRKFEEIMIPNELGDVAIYNELGRFITGPYGALITTVLHKKDVYKQYVGVDACASNLMRPMMYGAYHHISVLGKENAALTETYDVTGSLCENSDKFAVDRRLPHIDIGDVLYIHDTGAHGFSMGYQYNGKLRSAEVMLHADGSFDLIRRAETIKDYFATFDIYDEFRQ